MYKIAISTLPCQTVHVRTILFCSSHHYSSIIYSNTDLESSCFGMTIKIRLWRVKNTACTVPNPFNTAQAHEWSSEPKSTRFGVQMSQVHCFLTDWTLIWEATEGQHTTLHRQDQPVRSCKSNFPLFLEILLSSFQICHKQRDTKAVWRNYNIVLATDKKWKLPSKTS